MPNGGPGGQVRVHLIVVFRNRYFVVESRGFVKYKGDVVAGVGVVYSSEVFA